MLKLQNINVYYGVIHALKDVSLEVKEGTIVSLIGANGAGKTTLLKTISGLLKPTGGEITFDEHNLLSIPAQKIPQYGIVQVPEGRRIFAGLTVFENLQMGAYLRTDKEGIKKDLENIYQESTVIG